MTEQILHSQYHINVVVFLSAESFAGYSVAVMIEAGKAAVGEIKAGFRA